MPASACPAGIDGKGVVGCVILLSVSWALGLFSFQSCKSSGQQEESETMTAGMQKETGDEDDDDDNGVYNGLKHPQKANAWATRVLVSTSDQQPQAQVSECIEQITAIARDSGNQDDMVKAIALTKSLVAQNLPLYHHCFYQIAARLDDRLAQGGVVMTDLAYQFFDATKALWIMARALDGVSGKNFYFSYLKARYIQISKDVFGRDITSIGSPFDSRRAPGGGVSQPQNKPAGSVPAK